VLEPAERAEGGDEAFLSDIQRLALVPNMGAGEAIDGLAVPCHQHSVGMLAAIEREHPLAPRTVDEVCLKLARDSGEARLLAGGTDLILQMRRRKAVPRYLIGLKGVPDLAFIRSQSDGTVAIGATTTIRAIECSPLIREKYDFLSQTASEIGGPEIRHVATIGGNLSGALPCADFPAPLIALGATVKVKSQRAERILLLEEFFLGVGKTVAHPDELLMEIRLPASSPFSGGTYLKFHDRHAMDMTTTGVAAFVTLDPERQLFRDVTIALTTSAPIPLRAKGAEAALRGQALGKENLEEAARLACQEAEPRTSWRASREFRLELIRTLTKRALTRAWEKVRVASNAGGTP